MTTALKRHQHDDRRDDGKYRKTPACDGCGKPVGTNYYTDNDVCGSTDGPGFYVCDRKRCVKSLEKLDVEGRRAVYVATRESIAALTSPPKHSCEVERTFRRTHGKLNMATGAYTEDRSEIVTEPCGAPLFGTSRDDMARGVCESCRKGWTHPENSPTDRGRALIAASLTKQPLAVAADAA